MSDEHVPDIKTQVQLFEIRSAARTREIERRSMMKKTEALDQEQNKAIQEQRERDLFFKEGTQRLNNAQYAIVHLLKDGAAFKSVIEQLAASDPHTEAQTLERADRLFDEALKKIHESPVSDHKLHAWAKRQIATGSFIDKPCIKKTTP